MNRFCSIFSQLLQLFPRWEFQQLVLETKAERHARGFSSWGQFVAMLFCQLGRAHSLREICGGLASCEGNPKKKALVPLIGLETGSVRMAKEVMPSKGVPFNIENWPSVMIRGLEVLNRNNWFPMLTLMVGNPGETDEDVKATLDLIFEMERRGLFGFLVPSVFTPLEGTRMENGVGVQRTQDLSPLQWQLIMHCWKMNMRPGLYSWWGPLSYKLGGLLLWAVRLRKTNGKNFTWPMLDFCSALPHGIMTRLGKIYPGQPLEIKTRAELLASIKPVYWQHLRSDCGDLPMAIEPGLLAEPPKARVEQPVAG